jgi:hypothetical protein
LQLKRDFAAEETARQEKLDSLHQRREAKQVRQSFPLTLRRPGGAC